MAYDAQTADLFTKYVQHTNGKRKIANSVADTILNLNECSVLDVGAGSGHVAVHLAPLAKQLVCIEPNNELFEQLKSLVPPAVSSIRARLEDWVDDTRFDIVLLAYFLDTFYGDPHFVRLLDSAFSHAKQNGMVVAVSYIEGCAWDVFTEVVAKRLGVKRRGGYTRNVEQIRTTGYHHRVRNMFTSHVFGSSLDMLYDNLGFFFKRNLAGYVEERKNFIPLLERLAVHRDGFWLIEITEIVFSIHRSPVDDL
jgi:SAM-dependent methyltransferase